MRLSRAICRRLAAESGFGVVEVLAAAVVVAIGLVGAMTAFDAATKRSYGAQLHEQAISLGQGEIERLASYPLDELELDVAPTAVSDLQQNPDDPRAYVAGTDFLILRNYHDRTSGTPDELEREGRSTEPLILDPDADPAADGVSIPPTNVGVPLGPVSPTGAQETATVHRFITERAEPCLEVGAAVHCPDESRSKRLTVAVVLEGEDSSPGPDKPVYVSSVATELPEETP